MIRTEDLKPFKLFAGLKESELAKIAPLAQRRTCAANTYLFTYEKPATDLFLLEGPNDSIRLEIPLRNHRLPVVIHTVSKFEAFGWSSLVPPHKRVAAARCIENACLITIDTKSLHQIIEKDNHIGYLLMKNLSDLISSRFNDATIAFRHELGFLMRGKTPKHQQHSLVSN